MPMDGPLPLGLYELALGRRQPVQRSRRGGDAKAQREARAGCVVDQQSLRCAFSGFFDAQGLRLGNMTPAVHRGEPAAGARGPTRKTGHSPVGTSRMLISVGAARGMPVA